MADGLLDALRSEHPSRSLMAGRWARYRAFTGLLDDIEERKNWLPKGPGEVAEDYQLRVDLAEPFGWSKPALRRMAGRLIQDAPAVAHSDKSPSWAKTAIDAFLANCDGAGRSMREWTAHRLYEVLCMGIGLVEIAQPKGKLTPPILRFWRAEEIYDWGEVEGHPDVLDFVVLRRVVRRRGLHSEAPEEREVFRVLTRTQTITYEVEKASEAPVERVFQHDLGVVPAVPRYALPLGLLQGESYIAEISAADLVAYRLGADQNATSWMHANPILKWWRKRPFDSRPPQQSQPMVGPTGIPAPPPPDLTVGISRVQKLDVGTGNDDREDIDYAKLDTGGMEIRERMIERVQEQGLRSAGIDPSLATKTGSSRSGASIAWAFSTAETPILTIYSDQMDISDTAILEVVARCMSTNPPTDHGVKVWGGSVTRPKKWTTGTDQDAITETAEVKATVRSSLTLHRHMEKRLAARFVPAGSDVLRTIEREIDAANRDEDSAASEEDALTGGTR